MSVRPSEIVDQAVHVAYWRTKHSISEFTVSERWTILNILFLRADIRVQWSGYRGDGRQRLRGDWERPALWSTIPDLGMRLQESLQDT